ncbi:MAG TPA: hypothetical protein GX507_10190 [Clostridia bacterium]|nr:hypothetical protein [Clostridia bacterium]
MDFETLEVFVFRLALPIVRHALGRILEEMDAYLAVVRDKTRYASEEIEERVLDTLIGPIRFKRRCYTDAHTERSLKPARRHIPGKCSPYRISSSDLHPIV